MTILIFKSIVDSGSNNFFFGGGGRGGRFSPSGFADIIFSSDFSILLKILLYSLVREQ